MKNAHSSLTTYQINLFHENFSILYNILLNLVPVGPFNYKSALLQIMACRCLFLRCFSRYMCVQSERHTKCDVYAYYVLFYEYA